MNLTREDLLLIAIKAAKASGKELMSRFRKRLRISEKPDDGLVTDADFASERAAITVLKRFSPHFGILTEESRAQTGTGKGRWILDPLDGTSNYAHGFPIFCVAIAAEVNREIVAGVVYQPVTQELFSVIRGKGSFVNGKRMRVSRTMKLRDAFLSTGFSSAREQWFDKEIVSFENLSWAANAIRRPGSAALDLAQVACGRFDGFWERGLKAWDVAAGALMIEEAGGKVSDFRGATMDMNAQQILATNGRIHRELILEAGFKR